MINNWLSGAPFQSIAKHNLHDFLNTFKCVVPDPCDDRVTSGHPGRQPWRRPIRHDTCGKSLNRADVCRARQNCSCTYAYVCRTPGTFKRFCSSFARQYASLLSSLRSLPPQPESTLPPTKCADSGPASPRPDLLLSSELRRHIPLAGRIQWQRRWQLLVLTTVLDFPPHMKCTNPSAACACSASAMPGLTLTLLCHRCA